jgi:hypothetical protein
MRHLFVVDSLDKQIQNEKMLIHLASAGMGGLFFICVESINLTCVKRRAHTQNPKTPKTKNETETQNGKERATQIKRAHPSPSSLQNAELLQIMEASSLSPNRGIFLKINE